MNEAEKELARLAAEQHGVFTHIEAKKVGLTDRQIERRVASDWESLFEGVYRFRGTPATFNGGLLAACLNAAEPAGASRRAAAFVYGTRDAQELIEITCRRWKRTRVSGPIVHESSRFDEADITIVDRVPIVTPERLVFDVAATRPYPDAIEGVIQALRRKRLITYSSMLETYERRFVTTDCLSR
jgi:predicted transcriptional regulator of viral defense system